jgi:hypothetical protein
MDAISGGQIKVGDLVYDKASDKFQRVVATHGEQGSGPRPTRAWVAYEGNPRIQEIDLSVHYVVRRGALPNANDDAHAPLVESEETFNVVCQEWVERERGWGMRPDGYTLHLTKDDHDAWVKRHYARHTGPAPDEYTSTMGEPRLLAVDAATHKNLTDNKESGGDGIHVSQIDRSKLL